MQFLQGEGNGAVVRAYHSIEPGLQPLAKLLALLDVQVSDMSFKESENTRVELNRFPVCLPAHFLDDANRGAFLCIFFPPTKNENSAAQPQQRLL